MSDSSGNAANQDQGLYSKASQIMSKKPLLHKTCMDNGIDVPKLDNVSHGFLLDVYHDRVFVLKMSQVRYCVPKYKASAQALLGKYTTDANTVILVELVHALADAAATGLGLPAQEQVKKE